MNLSYLQAQTFYPIYNLSGKSAALDMLMVFGAKFLIFTTILGIAVLAFKGTAREKKAVFLMLLALTLAFSINRLIHLFFFQPRPFVAEGITPLITHEKSASFPSSHTTFMFTVAFSYLFYRSQAAVWVVAAAVWVAFARIFVGVHYPLDILGAVAVAFTSVTSSWQVKKWLMAHLT